MADTRLSHEILGGKARVDLRDRSTKWQASAFVAGREHRTSTKSDSLVHAKQIAEDWYLDLVGKQKRGEIKNEKTFKEAAAQFEREYEVITEGQRSPVYVQSHKNRIRVHLNPFFGSLALSDITAGKVQEYRMHRTTSRTDKDGAPLRQARTTQHHEIVTLRQVLKCAVRHGWLAHLPDLSAPYKMNGKIAHRAWFSPDE